MQDVNQTVLTGRLGKDAELKTTKTGIAVCTFSIANNKPKKKQGDQYVEQAPNWFQITAFGKLAEIIKPMLYKGVPVTVTAHLDEQSWEKDGVKQFKTAIIADQILAHGPKRSYSTPQGQSAQRPTGSDYNQGTQAVPPEDEMPDEEIPGF